MDSHLSDKTRRLFVINDPNRERLCGVHLLYDGREHKEPPGTEAAHLHTATVSGWWSRLKPGRKQRQGSCTFIEWVKLLKPATDL